MKESLEKYNRDELIQFLQHYADNPELANDDEQVKGLISKIYKKAQKNRRKENISIIKKQDLLQKSKTELFNINDEFKTPQIQENSSQLTLLKKAQKCYCCKTSYHQLHFFYHQLCPECADFNYNQRSLTCDLTGHRALLTGGRIKIGYHLALKLLRAGCEVHLTTRFPNNALTQFTEEKDFSQWKDRLVIHGLDLRNIPAVQTFIAFLNEHLPSLDIIINNAAQTIKRPLDYYRGLLTTEQENFLLENKNNTTPIIGNADFPVGMFDNHKQQVDLRASNSWSSKLEDISTAEMLEIQLVNVTAPFMLNGGLKPLLKKSSNASKFIVNVSAMEGQFSRKNKTVFHPHTNMAKAALNMMTRTSADDYAKDNIYITSVDTGWITDENPAPKRAQLRDIGFIPPLDVIDGASRVFAPIANGVNNPDNAPYGVFLKDYIETDW